MLLIKPPPELPEPLVPVCFSKSPILENTSPKLNPKPTPFKPE